jgi:hypothetical protein
MQRMSGIATYTRQMADAAKPARMLETRKTVPGCALASPTPTATHARTLACAPCRTPRVLRHSPCCLRACSGSAAVGLGHTGAQCGVQLAHRAHAAIRVDVRLVSASIVDTHAPDVARLSVRDLNLCLGRNRAEPHEMVSEHVASSHSFSFTCATDVTCGGSSTG